MFYFPSCASTVADTKQTTHNSDRRVLVLIITQAMTILGTSHLRIFDEKKLPVNYAKYLEVMLEIAKHQSHKVSMLCLPFWNAFLNNNSLRSQVRFI